MRAPAAALCLALTVATVGGGRAQDARPGVFGEVLEVNAVNVEVVVTDKDGARVRGLQPSDFELLVDGQPVSIDFFTEVVGGVAAAQPAGETAPTNVPAVAAGEAMGVSWLVFIDDFFSIERDRDKVLDSLVTQLGLLGPRDRMAVVAWDGKRLAMLSSWTQSAPALERAFRAAKERPAHGLKRITERQSAAGERQLRRRIPGLPSMGVGDPQRLDMDERHYVDNLSAQISRSTSAVAATLRAFANPPGRKVLLLLDGGWPWRPSDYLLAGSRRLITEDVPGGEELYEPLTDTANRLGYTVYPVDVPGLSQQLVDVGEMSADVNVGATESNREHEVHFALHWMADSTGGRVYYNDRRFAALEESINDTRSFYWLGFSPQRQGDDQRHELEVRVKRDGLRVRAREDFQDLSRSAEVSMAVESALLFGNPPSAQQLQLTVGKPEKSSARRMRVPISLTVPLSELTPLPVGNQNAAGGATLQAALELRVAALDDEGNSSRIPVVSMHVDLDGPARQGDTGSFATTLELRRSPHQLVVALFEPVSGKVFSAAARVEP